MADVFINYARQDRDFAQELATGLKSRGLSVWSDLDLRGGDLFLEVIQNAMASAGCVLTVWSHHSVDSSWVQSAAIRPQARLDELRRAAASHDADVHAQIYSARVFGDVCRIQADAPARKLRQV
jgi:hypothetical protein